MAVTTRRARFRSLPCVAFEFVVFFRGEGIARDAFVQSDTVCSSLLSNRLTKSVLHFCRGSLVPVHALVPKTLSPRSLSRRLIGDGLSRVCCCARSLLFPVWVE